jgi:hypothetical protein
MTGTEDHCCGWGSEVVVGLSETGSESVVVVVVLVRISRPGWEGRWKRSVMDPICVSWAWTRREMLASYFGESLSGKIDCVVEDE